MLWSAPEVLRSKDRPVHGSPKADVYSFGIILEEIILRGGPFEEASMTLNPQGKFYVIIYVPVFSNELAHHYLKGMRDVPSLEGLRK